MKLPLTPPMFFTSKPNKMTKLNRRNFIKLTSTIGAGVITVPTIISACSRGKNGHVAPSDRINLMFIGSGNQGMNDLKSFITDKRVQITGICDVNKQSIGYWNGKIGGREIGLNLVNGYYSQLLGKNYTGCKSFEDFREVIA